MSANKVERLSATWLAVAEWAEAEIMRLHAALENEELKDIETATLRGQIKQARLLIALGKNEPDIEVPEPDNYGTGRGETTG